jgi:hypothetical protein
MLFSEVYSAYFGAVEAILKEAVSGPVGAARIDEIVREKAFAESVLTIGPALRSGEWPLLTPDGRTPLKYAPSMPLTLLEKRWLKALLLDPRIRLFDPPARGLEDVEPLFDPNDVYWFDQYLDGDPYADLAYGQRFRAVLQALREHRKLFIVYEGTKGRRIRGEFVPGRLEYSQKDDKFRLITLGGRRHVIRLQSMLLCEPDELFHPAGYRESARQAVLDLEITDERKALERMMLHFSHLRKETERTGEALYRMRLWYRPEDETELVIRVLSFGPMVRVIAPEDFRRQVVQRLSKQMELF